MNIDLYADLRKRLNKIAWTSYILKNFILLLALVAGVWFNNKPLSFVAIIAFVGMLIEFVVYQKEMHNI